jgi:hypothetical protein
MACGRRGRRRDQLPGGSRSAKNASVGQALQTSHKPTAVDQGRADALGQGLRRLGILDNMVVKRNDPASARELFDSNVDAPSLRE